MGKSSRQIKGENSGNSPVKDSVARPASCDVADALESLESAVDALASGPMTPEFIRKLFSLDLLDGVELDMFVDLLSANKSLKSALAESKAGGS